jgi:GNAT superfamily N-acetyltransferase
MKIVELFEAPDFGYSQFNNRDEEIKNLTFKIVETGKNVHALAYVSPTEILGQVSAHIKNDSSLMVIYATIDNAWKGTGLGQLLYDKMIVWAKQHKFKYFRSDDVLSRDGQKAWKRLGQRYQIQTVEYNNKVFYQINLTKVPMKESIIVEEPDFGYKHFVNRDDEIKNLRWNVKNEGRDGFIVTAVREHYDDPSESIHGNYEAILIARPTDSTIIQNCKSFTQTGHGIQISYAALSKKSKDYWHSTGLGQMLYDKAIQVAKKVGYDFFESDYDMSPYARKAWAKLANRYSVQKVKENGKNIFRIDLSK